MFGFPLIAALGVLGQEHFMGKVMNEWVGDIQEFVRIKLPHLVFVAVIAVVLGRLLRLITGRMIRIAEQHAAGQNRLSQVRTLAGVVRTTGLAIITVIVSMQFLAAIGVDLAPLLASAGIAGVAIGLAAQNIVKDMLNGSLILIEDQFNVGDAVTVAGLSGIVEAMTLRKTTIRGWDGTLFVVPNSQITTVANQSRDFSVTTLNISVDFSADPDRVMQLLSDTAHQVRTDEKYKDVFLEDPKVLGVDSLKGSQLLFPVVFKTRARTQFEAIREFQRRVRIALEENHLLPGDPLRVFNAFGDASQNRTGSPMQLSAEPAKPIDPTTLKPEESNPFSG